MRNTSHVFVLCLVLHVSVTVKVTEFSISGYNGGLNSTPSPKYRVSVPKSKEPLNRVPSHLQDIRDSYNETNDVIHIIEPPQHFQLLKRTFNQTNHNDAQTRKHHPNVRAIKPKSTNHPTTSMAMKVVNFERLSALHFSTQVNKKPELILKQAQKLNQRFEGNKFKRPSTQLATHKRQDEPVTSESDPVDLLSQGTNMHQLHVLPLSPQLPREVLVSVRKTDRSLYQQQPRQSQRASQRHKALTTHTVIMEQLYERDKFLRGNEHKTLGEKWRKSRTRRDVKDFYENDQIFAGARRADQQSTVLNALKNAKIDVQRGTKLLIHLNDLLTYANAYLPDEGEVVDMSPKHSTDVIENLNADNKTLLYRGNLDLKHFVEGSINVTDILKKNVISNLSQRRDENKRVSYNLNGNSRIFEKSPTFRTNKHTAGTLLYEDVMANIRNMHQRENLHILEHQHNGTKFSLNINHPKTSMPFENDDLIEAKRLEDYINELQRLVKCLPSSNNSIGHTTKS